MIDTPRTDEEEDACRECGLHFVPAEFSRQLERELHAMTLRCQAADRTANAALAAAPEGGAWISVNDRRPELSGYYQIWTTKMPPALTMDIIPSAYFYSAGEGGWSRHRGYGCHGEVTHWMPFPQPPMNSGPT